MKFDNYKIVREFLNNENSFKKYSNDCYPILNNLVFGEKS